MTTVMESLASFRVVVLHGARQVGKSTLARAVGHQIGAEYVTFDESADLTAAVNDPATYLDTLGTPLVLDEVQRAGDSLVVAVKRVVDGDRRAGRYLLTGSTNFLTVPAIAEKLAGRVDIVPLWPFSAGELSGGTDTFIDRAFAAFAGLVGHTGGVPTRDEYLEQVCRGGYPEVQHLTGRAQRRWFSAYVKTVLQREVEVAADIRRADALETMARLVMASTSQELVISALAARAGIDRATASTYEPWLETAFLVHRVPAWSRNLTAKVVHRPKLFAVDTGLAAGMLGKEASALRRPNDPAVGPLVETFVTNEITKQLGWSETGARLYHFRDNDGPEVDLVLEADDGRVLALEAKATSTPRPEDARWLALLRERLDASGGEFVGGVVFHTGGRRLPLGDRLIALPIADIWT
ncbi:MAG TPA: ATP-binding protein [Acidimicrobiales bacterium]|nr:ATP-binding protein [Acidimicrobiales bacterium]